MSQLELQKSEFEPLLLDQEKRKKQILLGKTPYFYNDQGTPSYLTILPEHIDLITVPTIDMQARKGKSYKVLEQMGGSSSEYGLQTQLILTVKLLNTKRCGRRLIPRQHLALP